MNNFRSVTLLSLILLISGGIFTACDEANIATQDPAENAYKYIVALGIPAQESPRFHVLEDLETGTADIAQSQEIAGLTNNVLVTTQPGFVYLNSAQKLIKYSVDNEGILKEKGSVPNTGASDGPVYTFLDNARLMVSTGLRQTTDSVFTYQIINTNTMKEEKKGTIKLPISKGATAIPSNYIVKEGKIYVPFIHSNDKYAAFDKAPVAIFNAATQAYEKTIYTQKTASLGYSIINSHGFTENGDLYLVSCNSDFWAANEAMPSGIVRINAGTSEFDDSYFLNMTLKLGGSHTGGMVYAGNNKAIVQVFDSNLIRAHKDYQTGFVIQYYETDLVTQAVRKLDIPLSKYPGRALERLKNGKVAIMANTQSAGSTIYVYNSDNGEVKKGMEYKGAQFMSGIMSFE
jgi:hypothetical protein